LPFFQNGMQEIIALRSRNGQPKVYSNSDKISDLF
jgi:hypothetical protein